MNRNRMTDKAPVDGKQPETFLLRLDQQHSAISGVVARPPPFAARFGNTQAMTGVPALAAGTPLATAGPGALGVRIRDLDRECGRALPLLERLALTLEVLACDLEDHRRQ